MQTSCSCPCEESEVIVKNHPVIRFICHCKICQEVYRKPFADIVAVRSNQVIKPINPTIRFAKHRFPPAVNRGFCPSCNSPVVAFLPLAPAFGLSFIPAENFSKDYELPKPVLHSFYDRRVDDVDDNLPKFNGYWPSQWAVSSRFVSTILRLG
ncbi:MULTISPECIES: GFA family protein [unclassified Colwellia]|uniref:GFA family protein n=1 Tax=unclassified Colwellia TaxID=196834 RepID=UPI0015F579DA|nr:MULTISPECIES: GFA family protein [unclassified Colwellia]MBA6258214.1 GFA family protein [Colwellia sp. MB3u-28]MBA6259641.1 GFA family protein [Colwellia sp. MB3u-41]MBA6304593.1 GFA family protein [Colwellia sp. MB02u-14]MBA6311621.1 GFA family protein [Colwellia sp. MB3u-64]MBA6232866.1 GFA family protein [Colwellia sp. MB02u-7]